MNPRLDKLSYDEINILLKRAQADLMAKLDAVPTGASAEAFDKAWAIYKEASEYRRGLGDYIQKRFCK